MSSSDRDFIGVFALLFQPSTWASRVHFSRGTTVVLLACSAFTITCTGLLGLVALVAFAKFIDWLDPIIERSLYGTAHEDEKEGDRVLRQPQSPLAFSGMEFDVADHGSCPKPGLPDRPLCLCTKGSDA